MKNTNYSKIAALSTVIANMIGVGVFSSLGFQVIPFENGGIPDKFSILLIWFLGGVIALCGALTYSEIATTLKRSGGEYVYLSKLYHPSIGFASGWISLIVGFAGAIASAGLAIGKYSAPALGIDVSKLIGVFGIELSIQKVIAISIILLLSFIHLAGTKIGGFVQSFLTAFKIGLILIFCAAPFFISSPSLPISTDFYPTEASLSIIFSFSFASALVWVMYAYSGWNAVVYISGNVDNPIKTIPFVLIGGTLIVTFLYIFLNASFMSVASFEEMSGKEDIGNIVALKLFGESFGGVFSAIFSFALFSTMSAMIIAGPRVSEQIGQDFSFFKKISIKNNNGIPVYAILLQALISIVLVLFSTFQELIQTLGLTLSFFALLTVIGIFIIRKKYPHDASPVKTWGYPFTPILFILATIWMIVSFALIDSSKILYSILAILPGILIYFVVQKKSQ